MLHGATGKIIFDVEQKAQTALLRCLVKAYSSIVFTLHANYENDYCSSAIPPIILIFEHASRKLMGKL